MTQDIRIEDVVDFFNHYAPTWDERCKHSAKKIKLILDNAGVHRGSKVLDIACGTGVLITDYLERDVSFVHGVDISPKMIEIAQSKFNDPRVKFTCADAMDADLGDGYDCIVIYNAFPHFTKPDRLLKKLTSLLVPGGIITVAHGSSREEIDSHHTGFASKVSMGLMPETHLAELMGRFADVTCIISNDEMYQVTARRPY